MNAPQPRGERFIGQPADQKARVTKRALPLRAGTRLTDLLDAAAFFTPAPLYLWGYFEDYLLADFMAALGRDVPVFLYRNPRPLFAGLEVGGNPAWNHALWAVPRADWPAFANFMVGVVLSDRENNQVWGVGQQDLHILDPLALAPTPLPVAGFGVNGSKFRCAFAKGKEPGALPKLVRYPPDPKMLAFVRARAKGFNAMDARG